MRNRRGQTILEYTVIMIIILGVVITMKDYIKRGFQGRWKSATDDFGDQYDPQRINSSVTYATVVNAQSEVQLENSTGDVGGQTVSGQWTNRVDSSISQENKAVSTQIGN